MRRVPTGNHNTDMSSSMISSQRIVYRVTSGVLRRRPAAPTSSTFAADSAPPAAAASYHTTVPTLNDEDGPKTKQLKVKKKVKNSAKKAEGGRDRHLDLILRALDAPILKPPPASEEEMQRRHGETRAEMRWLVGDMTDTTDLFPAGECFEVVVDTWHESQALQFTETGCLCDVLCPIWLP